MYQHTLFILFSLFVGTLHAEASETLTVSGWPMTKDQLFSAPKPPNWLAQDPVIGRLTCPAFARVTTVNDGMEELILRNISSVGTHRGNPSEWRLELREGIYWWSGHEVTAADLRDFLERELTGIVQEKGGGLWPVPTYKVAVQSKTQVSVQWKTAPAFGPYIVAGVSLWRPQTGKETPFECVGWYRPVAKDKTLALEALPRQKVKFPTVALTSENTRAPAPAVNFNNKGAGCKQPIELPLFTAVAWNPHIKPTSSMNFRIAMTQLLPRGEFLKTGFQGLGDLVSAPLWRKHPGYNAATKVYPYSLENASNALNMLGYKIKTGNGPRSKSASKDDLLQLNIRSFSRQPVLEKLISDALGLEGVGVKISDTPLGKDEEHGRLLTFGVDPTTFDFLAQFHSKSAQENEFWHLNDKDLDKNLESYSLSITWGKPEFAMLQKIHERLHQLEPLSILLQHRVCVETEGPVARIPLDATDADWFRRLIL